jgi:hypothetical protein
VTQAVERLLCKCEALSSNPNPTENKNILMRKKKESFTFILPFFFGGMGFETQGLTLARHMLYHLSHLASPKVLLLKHFFLAVLESNLGPCTCYPSTLPLWNSTT